MSKDGIWLIDETTKDPYFVSYEDLDDNVMPQLLKPVGGFIYEASSFLNLPLPEVPFYVKDWLPKQGKAEIYGQAKAGKSFLAIQLARCIASGEDFIGMETSRAPVLYLQFELGAKILQDRMRSTGQSYDDVFLGTTFSMKLDTPSGQKQFLRAIVAVEPKVIILDPFYKIISGDENESQDVIKITNFLDEIIEGFNCSILLLHHAGKDLSRGGRGSSVLEGWADSYLEMKRVSRNGEALRANITPKLLRHASLPPESIELVLSNNFEFESVEGVAKSNTILDKVRGRLTEKGQATGGELIAEGVGRRKSIYDALKTLQENGQVVKEGLIYSWVELKEVSA